MGHVNTSDYLCLLQRSLSLSVSNTVILLSLRIGQIDNYGLENVVLPHRLLLVLSFSLIFSKYFNMLYVDLWRLIYWMSVENVTQPDVFTEILNQNLNEAIAMLSAYNYGIQNALYSLVQCLPGLLTEDSRACLNLVVYRVLAVIKGKRGGKLKSTSYTNGKLMTSYILWCFPAHD